jgi:hypothetical protein
MWPPYTINRQYAQNKGLQSYGKKGIFKNKFCTKSLEIQYFFKKNGRFGQIVVLYIIILYK